MTGGKERDAVSRADASGETAAGRGPAAPEPVAVIGAGLMGSGIAQVFAAAGRPVTLHDLTADALERALDGVRRTLTVLAGHGLGRLEDIEPAVARIGTSTDLEEAAAGATFVVECVFEDMALKQDVFRRLDACCPPETVLATNTSVMSVTEIAGRATRRGRIVGTHFWNPPYLIPLVEVVRAADTTVETMERTMALLAAVGKHPVRVEKDVPGFVANRLQHALWREAVSIVERGIADAATVDECVRYGFGLRLPVLAPLENADMVGLDLTLSIHDYILPHLEASPEPSPLLRRKVEAGELGFKSGRGFQEWTPEQAQASRDRLLAYLVGVLGRPPEVEGPIGP